eukprot:6376972-Prymnesium_polylepis.2
MPTGSAAEALRHVRVRRADRAVSRVARPRLRLLPVERRRALLARAATRRAAALRPRLCAAHDHRRTWRGDSVAVGAKRRPRLAAAAWLALLTPPQRRTE